MVASELTQCAARLGIVDALLFRAIDGVGWRLSGGIGAGERWSGALDLSEADLAAALVPSEPGWVRRFQYRESSHVIGAFFAMTGALVRVRHDVVVVVGNPRGRLAGDASDESISWLASALDQAAVEAGHGDADADQLHIERAVHAITTSSRTDVWSILAHAADVAAEALRCEVAIVRAADGRVGATSTWGSIDVCDSPVLDAALDELQIITGGGAACIQNAQGEALPELFSWPQGARSLLIIPIPGPLGGHLVVAHTLRSARGFTDLCRRIGEQIGDAIGVVGYAAMLRESQHEVADSHALAA